MNVDLATKALRAAKASPERFDMDNWVTGLHGTAVKEDLEFVPPCGTTACYAGWVSFLAAPVGSKITGQRVILPGRSEGVHVERYAVEALEITREQSFALFYLDNIEQVERAVKHLADSPDAGEYSLREAARQTR